MLRLLLTRRWVVLSLVFLVLIPVMAELGFWQFHRWQQTNRSDRVTSSNLAAAPVPMEQLSHPGATVPASDTYRRVTATGHFDTAGQFVVRRRTDAAGTDQGYYLITPLVTADDGVVLVNRGWVAPNNDNGAAFPKVPGTPTGTVTVSGRLRPDETAAITGIHEVKGLPPRQYMLINSAEQQAALHRPVVAGYLELTGSSPKLSAADSAELVPGPNADSQNSSDDAVVGKGVHLPYAVQWWLFALMLPLAWLVLFRRDLRNARDEEEGGTVEGTPKKAPAMTVEEYMARRREAAAQADAQADVQAGADAGAELPSKPVPLG